MPDRLRLPVGSRSPGAVPAGACQGSVADETLVRQVAEGDAAALAVLYRRYGTRLFGFLQRYAGDRMLAEEILQDTLLAVWRSAGAVRGTFLGADLVVRRRPTTGPQPAAGPPAGAGPLDAVAGPADPSPGPAELAVARRRARR